MQSYQQQGGDPCQMQSGPQGTYEERLTRVEQGICKMTGNSLGNCSPDCGEYNPPSNDCGEYNPPSNDCGEYNPPSNDFGEYNQLRNTSPDYPPDYGSPVNQCHGQAGGNAQVLLKRKIIRMTLPENGPQIGQVFCGGGLGGRPGSSRRPSPTEGAFGDFINEAENAVSRAAEIPGQLVDYVGRGMNKAVDFYRNFDEGADLGEVERHRRGDPKDYENTRSYDSGLGFEMLPEPMRQAGSSPQQTQSSSRGLPPQQCSPSRSRGPSPTRTTAQEEIDKVRGEVDRGMGVVREEVRRGMDMAREGVHKMKEEFGEGLSYAKGGVNKAMDYARKFDEGLGKNLGDPTDYVNRGFDEWGQGYNMGDPEDEMRQAGSRGGASKHNFMDYLQRGVNVVKGEVENVVEKVRGGIPQQTRSTSRGFSPQQTRSASRGPPPQRCRPQSARAPSQTRASSKSRAPSPTRATAQDAIDRVRGEVNRVMSGIIDYVEQGIGHVVEELEHALDFRGVIVIKDEAEHVGDNVRGGIPQQTRSASCGFSPQQTRSASRGPPPQRCRPQSARAPSQTRASSKSRAPTPTRATAQDAIDRARGEVDRGMGVVRGGVDEAMGLVRGGDGGIMDYVERGIGLVRGELEHVLDFVRGEAGNISNPMDYVNEGVEKVRGAIPKLTRSTSRGLSPQQTRLPGRGLPQQRCYPGARPQSARAHSQSRAPSQTRSSSPPRMDEQEEFEARMNAEEAYELVDFVDKGFNAAVGIVQKLPGYDRVTGALRGVDGLEQGVSLMDYVEQGVGYVQKELGGLSEILREHANDQGGAGRDYLGGPQPTRAVSRRQPSQPGRPQSARAPSQTRGPPPSQNRNQECYNRCLGSGPSKPLTTRSGSAPPGVAGRCYQGGRQESVPSRPLPTRATYTWGKPLTGGLFDRLQELEESGSSDVNPTGDGRMTDEVETSWLDPNTFNKEQSADWADILRMAGKGGVDLAIEAAKLGAHVVTNPVGSAQEGLEMVRGGVHQGAGYLAGNEGKARELGYGGVDLALKMGKKGGGMVVEAVDNTVDLAQGGLYVATHPVSTGVNIVEGAVNTGVGIVRGGINTLTSPLRSLFDESGRPIRQDQRFPPAQGQGPQGQGPRGQGPRGQGPQEQVPREQGLREQVPRGQGLREQVPRGQGPFIPMDYSEPQIEMIPGGADNVNDRVEEVRAGFERIRKRLQNLEDIAVQKAKEDMRNQH